MASRLRIVWLLAILLRPAEAQLGAPPSPWSRAPTHAVTTHLVDDVGRPLDGAWVWDLVASQGQRAGPGGLVTVRAYTWYAGGSLEISLRVRLPGFRGYCSDPVADPQCVRLKRVGNLVGIVIGAGGRPLPGVVVSARDPDGEDRSLAGSPVVTDESGQWLLPGVPRLADVNLMMRLPGERQQRGFTVWPGHTACRIRPPQRVLTGRIVLDAEEGDTAGQGVDFESINVIWGRSDHFTVTPRDGGFTLSDPPAGRLKLTAKRGALTLEPTDTFDVPPGGLLNVGTLRARRPPEVVVTVQRPDGQPAAEARLYWERPAKPGEGDPESDVEHADEHGAVRFRQSPGPLQLFGDDGSYHGRLDVVQTAAGLKTTLRLLPTPLRPMRVRLVDQRGDAFTPAELTWTQSSYSSHYDTRVTTDAQGRAAVPVWPDAGPVTLDIASEELCYDAEQVLTPRFEQEMTITLPLAGRFPVTGRLLDRAGRAVVGEPVVLKSDGPDLTATTDSQGRFRLERVGCWIECRLSLPRHPDAFSQPPYLPPAGGARDFGSLALPGSGDVCEGQVIGLDGRPAAQVEVLVCGTARTTRSDAAGHFRLTGLRSGAVRLLALLGADQRAEATVPEGVPAQLRLKRWRATADLYREQATAALHDAVEATLGRRMVQDGAEVDDLIFPALAMVPIDAAEAMRLINLTSPERRGAVMAELLESVAQHDPDLAARNLSRLAEISPPERRRLATARVAALLAPTRRAAVERLFDEVRGYQPAVAERMELDLARARLAALLGRPEAAGWAESAAGGFGTAEHTRRYDRWSNMIETGGAAWLAEWPELVEQFCAHLPEEPLRQAARAAAVARLAALQPNTAVALHQRWFPVSNDAADSRPDSAQQHLRRAALRLAPHDPARAIEWAEALPQLADRRAVRTEAARRTTDRATGEAILLRLGEADASVDTLAQIWQRWDPAVAADLVARAERLAASSERAVAPLAWALVKANAGRRWLETQALVMARARAQGRRWPGLPSTQYVSLDPVRYRELAASEGYRVTQLVSLARSLLTQANRLEPDPDAVVRLPWVEGRWSE